MRAGHESQTPESGPRKLPPGDAGPLPCFTGKCRVKASATHFQSGTKDLIQDLVEVV